MVVHGPPKQHFYAQPSNFLSPLGQRLLAARRVEREWGFNYRVPGEEMLLQGVLDAAFLEDDGWVILDYKTDRIEDKAAFVERYEGDINSIIGFPVARIKEELDSFI